jgi:uncharacterized protein YbjT (DUF2867 family)
MTDRIVAVVGATGLQGRAVTTRLLAEGWRVRALTRNRDGAAARELAAAGARVVHADMEEVGSLVAAADGAHGLFSVQPTVGSPGTSADFSADDEVRWGVNVADAAKIVGVEHLVFSSVAGAGRHDSEVLPRNSVSKWQIERHIAEFGVPATILRPVSFMENYTGAYHLNDGAVTTGFEPDVAQQVIAVDDLAAFSALAFAQPREWVGRAIDLAGDQLTPVQIAAAIGDAIGQPVPYVQIPLEAIERVSPDFAYAYQWLNERGYRADINRARRLYPGLTDFRAWLDKTGADQISAFLTAPSAR